MAQRFYNLKLENGRQIGPVDLNRIKLFIANDKVTGLEKVQEYPEGQWKDINSFPEIADYLLQRLEGKLSHSGDEFKEFDPASQNPDNEQTQLTQHDDEKTIIKEHEIELQQDVSPSMPTIPYGETSSFDRGIANQKTQMLSIPPLIKAKLNNKRSKILIVLLLLAALMVLVVPEDNSDKKSVKFSVQMPETVAKQDPVQSELMMRKAMPLYYQDTVDGYKRASNFLLKAAALDQNNVKAICLLASSYLNLIDVVKKDENYFNVVTRLIELARTKGVDLTEIVISDVELYLALGNPEAAISRISEFTQTHSYGKEMYSYIAQSFLAKNDPESTLKFLGQIERKDWYTPRIPYLYARAFEKLGKPEDAIKAYKETVKMAKNHVKARVSLMEFFYKTNNLVLVRQQIDFITENPTLASKSEIAKTLYYSARIKEVNGSLDEAKLELEAALKLQPDEPDYLLEYYTVRARLGETGGEGKAKAKMFSALAQGEQALKDKDLMKARAFFLSARQAQETDAIPLLRLADVFKRLGELQTAKINFQKAIKLAPTRSETYPKYIKTLVDLYEFEEAKKQIEIFKAMSPSQATLDRIIGEMYFKQERLAESLSYLKRAMGDVNADSSIYILYATTLFRLNAFQDAAFYFGLALRFDPFNPEAIIGIGKSLAELENTQRGVEYIAAAVSNNPKKAELMNGIAEIYLRKGDNVSAQKYVEQSLGYDHEFPAAYKTKGEILVAQEKTRAALDAFQSYSNHAPGDPAGMIKRYEIYHKKMDLKAAKEEIQKVIEAFPRYPGAYRMLGELFKDAQNFNSALEAAKQEIAYNPAHVPAYVLAGRVHIQKKEYQQALDTLNRALKLDPNYVPTLIQAGDINRLMKSYAASKTLLQRAMKLDQGNPEIHKRLAVLFIEMGDKELAKQHVRAYIELYPDAPDREEYEKYLGK